MSPIGKVKQKLGLSSITLIFLIVVMGSLAYTIYQVAPFYYYYYDLLNNMEVIVKEGTRDTDQQLKDKIYKKVKELGIRADPQDIVILHDMKDNLSVELKYEEVFYTTIAGKDYDIYVFDFDAKIERSDK